MVGAPGPESSRIPVLTPRFHHPTPRLILALRVAPRSSHPPLSPACPFRAGSCLLGTGRCRGDGRAGGTHHSPGSQPVQQRPLDSAADACPAAPASWLAPPPQAVPANSQLGPAPSWVPLGKFNFWVPPPLNSLPSPSGDFGYCSFEDCCRGVLDLLEWASAGRGL